MRFQVDVEEYGTITVGKKSSGPHFEIKMDDVDEEPYTVVFTRAEFEEFANAVSMALNYE